MPPTPPSDDYDNPWKTALEHALPEFVAFYFPEAYRQIDWSRGYRFLDKELKQIVRDADIGRRHVDKLVSAHTYAGEEEWICIHIEVQGQHDREFARRMFVYNYRIFDRYSRAVASLAVLGDEDPHWRPDRFGFELLGCSHQLWYPIAKLIDFEESIESLAANPNPFALVTAAHLETARTRRDPARRFVAKRHLTRLLYERNWSKARIIDFFAVLDWMMRLPDKLEDELWQDIENIEGERQVKYVTSVERLATKRGIEQGLQRGREEGLQQGRLEGRTEGRAEGIAIVLVRQLNRRFGPLSAAVTDRIGNATADQLERWTERVLDARTLDDVFAQN